MNVMATAISMMQSLESISIFDLSDFRRLRRRQASHSLVRTLRRSSIGNSFTRSPWRNPHLLTMLPGSDGFFELHLCAGCPVLRHIGLAKSGEQTLANFF